MNEIRRLRERVDALPDIRPGTSRARQSFLALVQTSAAVGRFFNAEPLAIFGREIARGGATTTGMGGFVTPVSMSGSVGVGQTVQVDWSDDRWVVTQKGGGTVSACTCTGIPTTLTLTPPPNFGYGFSSTGNVSLTYVSSRTEWMGCTLANCNVFNQFAVTLPNCGIQFFSGLHTLQVAIVWGLRCVLGAWRLRYFHPCLCSFGGPPIATLPFSTSVGCPSNVATAFYGTVPCTAGTDQFAQGKPSPPNFEEWGSAGGSAVCSPFALTLVPFGGGALFNPTVTV